MGKNCFLSLFLVEPMRNNCSLETKKHYGLIYPSMCSRS